MTAGPPGPGDHRDPGGTAAGAAGTAGTVASVIRLAAEAAAVDGVPPLSGHVLEAIAAGDGRLPVFVEDGALSGTTEDGAVEDGTVSDGCVDGGDGIPAGVTAFPPDDPAELFVVPAHRGRGLGRDLVARALERAGAVWAHGDLPAARAVAATLGLTRSRELLQLGRPVPSGVGSDAFPDPLLPAGVSVRTFRPGVDDDAFLAVNRAAFAWHPEQGRLDRAGLAVEMSQDWFDPEGFFLAVSGTGNAERVLGFHWTKVHPGGEGEIYVLGVDPAAGVRGLGGVLTRVGLDHLVGRGVPSLILYVEGDNERARRLYERFGFAVTRTDVVYRPTP